MRLPLAPRLVLLRLWIWPAVLMATCCPPRVWPVEPTSPAPSVESQTVPLQTCLDAVTAVETTAHEQVTLLTTLFREQLTRLESDYAERLRAATVASAAEAARPLLVELADVRAESAAWQRQVVVLRWVAVGVGAGAAVVGVLLGLLLHPG